MIRAKPDRPKAATAKKPLEPASRPAGGAAWGERAKFFPVTLSLDKAMITRLDDKAHAMRMTRSAAIRALLSEALAK